MKFRGLMVAAIALLVLAGGVYWSNKKQQEKETKPATDTNTPKIVAIPDDQIKQVRIQKTGGETTVLNRGDNGKWQIAEPKPLAADPDSVSSLTSTLSSLNADRVIEEKPADLSPYGLNKPSLEIGVTKKDGKTEKLLLGDDTPTGGSVFARLESDPKVYTVGSFVKTSLDKTSKDLRDKRLLTFDSEKLTRVELQAKNQTLEFGKNNQNDWQILKPKPMRADNSQVEELIRKLKDAKMDTSVSDEDAKKAAVGFGAGTKVALATVTDASANQTLEVRKDKDKNYYAKSSVIEGIYKVGSDLGEGLDKGAEDFRNKKLFDFGWNDPTKVQAGGAKYQKSGDKWMSGQKQMDSATVQTLIDRLRDLAATKFPESGGGSPVLEITVTSNDGKRVEKVTLTRQGDRYFAKRENEPSIYELDAKAVDELQKAVGGVKEAQPAAAKKK